MVQGQILDSKEYYAPIVTPFEAQLAFSGGQWGVEYRLDFEQLLKPAEESKSRGDEPRFSLLDGNYHASDTATEALPSTELALKEPLHLQGINQKAHLVEVSQPHKQLF